MGTRAIVWYPDAPLRVTATTVTEFDGDLARLAMEMGKSMFAAGGIGLAANQIGDTRNVCVVHPSVVGRSSGDPPVVYVNPKIVDTGTQLHSYQEGCLSFPKCFVWVERPGSITVQAHNMFGAEFTTEVTGTLARVLQHEIDHLSGKLIIDHTNSLRRDSIKNKVRIARRRAK